MQDYLESFTWWSEQISRSGIDSQVMIVENTGADLTRLTTVFARHGLRVEAISYEEDSAVVRRGKGVCEALMLDRAIERFRVMGLAADDAIVKVTGRLRLSDIRQIPLRRLQEGNSICIRIKLDRRDADSRVFAASFAVWNLFLIGIASSLDEEKGEYFEHELALRTALALRRGVLPVSFAKVPRILGRSGSTGVSYGGRRVLLRERVAHLVLKRIPDAYL